MRGYNEEKLDFSSFLVEMTEQFNKLNSLLDYLAAA